MSAGTAARVRQVLSARPAAADAVAHDSALPEPVQSYFSFTHVDRHQVPSPVRMEQEGEFRLGLEGSWRPFTAVQHINPAGPAFLWQARIRLFPGVHIAVEDGYCDGVGRLDARLWGLLPLARRANDTSLAAGELHRYLAEAVWNPAALRPGQGVVWDPIDRNSARVSLTVKGITVSLDCLFDRDGRLIKAFSRERYRDVGGTAVLTPWLCEYRNYIRLNRVMVPQEGEVSWILPQKTVSYCRLRVTGIQQLTAPAPH